MNATFRELWREIAPIGRARNGYLRFALTEPELTLRDWFRAQASVRDMTVTEDGNGNLFAWRGEPWAPLKLYYNHGFLRQRMQLLQDEFARRGLS